jgi:hypothetical protein
MAGSRDGIDEAALWRRWRSAAVSVEAAAPDTVLLAAYAEDRLSEEAAEPVEDWLAAHPEAVADILAARLAASAESSDADPALVERAIALVVAGDAQILPFRRPARPSWRTAAMWSGMAASLVVTSMIGFTLGNSAYLSMTISAAPALGQELFDPPTGLFNSLDEDPNT